MHQIEKNNLMKTTKFNDFTSITFNYINDLLWDDYENQIFVSL